jgi:hypothetical protein
VRGARAAWKAEVAPYAHALRVVARTCRRAARARLGLKLPDLRVLVVPVAAGGERVSTDYGDSITVEAASGAQFRPSSPGCRWIYGVAHEAAHIAVARLLGPHHIPPVIWDEALAHFVATRVFLAEVWAEHGEELWPDPYPDYASVEAALPFGSATHFDGYLSSLRALDAWLCSLDARVGTLRAVTALRVLGPRDMRVDRFGPALERACLRTGTARTAR